jgi:hypothetical protein
MKCKKTGAVRGYSQCMMNIGVKDVYAILEEEGKINEQDNSYPV